MFIKPIVVGCVAAAALACNPPVKDPGTQEDYADIQLAGAMKNVMWKGELQGVIDLDTISNRDGLYGLGPPRTNRL